MARPKNLAPAKVRVYQTASGRWNVTWTDPKTGNTRHASCGTHDKAVAEANAGAIITNKSTPKARAGFAVAELLTAYQEHEGSRTAATQAETIRDVRHQLQHEGADTIGPVRRLRPPAPNASLAAVTGFQGTGLTEAHFLALHPLERMSLINKMTYEKSERDKESAEELAALPPNWAEHSFNMRQHHIEQRAIAKRSAKAVID